MYKIVDPSGEMLALLRSKQQSPGIHLRHGGLVRSGSESTCFTDDACQLARLDAQDMQVCMRPGAPVSASLLSSTGNHAHRVVRPATGPPDLLVWDRTHAWASHQMASRGQGRLRMLCLNCRG